MGKVTESIYTSNTVVIPMADVSHVVRRGLGIQVVTKHSTWNAEFDDYNNTAWIANPESDRFLSAWCRYRSELESETLVDLSIHDHVSSPQPSNNVDVIV
jgi:hypothetical protein